MPTVVIAAAVAAIGVLLFGTLGVAGAHFRWIPPLAGFALAAGLGLLLCGAAATVLGIVGALKTRPGAGQPGAPIAWIALAVGLGSLATIYLLAPPEGMLPIHDLTTDPNDPPQFRAALEEPGNAGRDLGYPHGPADTAAQQREAYPDLEPIVLALDPDQAYARCLETARGLGWRILAEDPATRTFEAVDETPVFRFADDVIVRVRDEGTRARVDVRSTSRVGRSDLGANATRIRRFRARLVGD